MTTPRLSVCIPTYNFGAFIGGTLDSITKQLPTHPHPANRSGVSTSLPREGGNAIEIVVLDSASTDDTERIVRGYQERFPQIVYHRAEKKGGIDRDMAKVVSLATGEYCWLFSADDVMRKGALAEMLVQTAAGYDVCLAGFTLCTSALKPVNRHPILASRGDRVFEMSDPAQRLEYFRLAQTSTAFFSFISSLVFKRARWDAFTLEEAWVGSCWGHVPRFLRMMDQGMRVKYLAGSYLLKRMDNDSFMDKGIAHRVGISVDGFHRLAAEFLGADSEEAFHMRRVLQNEFTVQALLARKLECRDQAERDAMDRVAERIYGEGNDADRTKLALYRNIPLPLIRIAKNVRELQKQWT